MELITEEMKKRFKEVGDQSKSQNPLFVMRIYNPIGAQSWYVSEYDEESGRYACFVKGTYSDQWSWFSIRDIVSIKNLLGIEMKLDLNFKEKTFDELANRKNHRRLSELNTESSNTKSKNLKQEIEH